MTRERGSWTLARRLGDLMRPTDRSAPEPEDNRAAVDEVARLVLAFNQSPEDASDARRQALMTADDGCQDLLQEFRIECLQRAPGSPASEDGWSALEGAHRQFARGYEKFLMAHKDGDHDSATDSHLATISSRLLFHAGAIAKLEFFRARLLDGRTWHLVHKVYAYIEEAGLERRTVVLYTQPERIETTCEAVYARLLMLDTLNGSGLNPRQIEIADNWLGDWVSLDMITKAFVEARYRYQFDLASAVGPVRVMQQPHGDSIRFIDTELVCVQADRLKTSLRSGEMSGLLGLSAGFNGVDFSELLDRLERAWSISWIGQEQRGHRRERVENQHLEVVRGLPEFCRASRRDVAGPDPTRPAGGTLTPAEELDLKIYGFVTERTRERLAANKTGEQSGAERWLIFDRSVTGFGTIIPANTETGLRSGTLLGLRLPGSRRWTVGVVARRVALRDTGEIFVGIEVISTTPVIVSIEPATRDLNVASPLSIPPGRENHWALFIPGDTTASRPDSLIIDTSMYSTGRQFSLAARNAVYTVKMNRIVGKGDGWQRVGFEVLAKRG